MQTFNRTLKTAGKQLLHLALRVGQTFGVSILPKHFYSSVPDIKALKADDFWRKPRTMSAVKGAQIDGQLAFLESVVTEAVKAELSAKDIHAQAVALNGHDGGYGVIEADMLYAVVRTLRPSKVVQIGAGVSTAVVLAACDEGRVPIDLACIDPFPTEYLQTLSRQGKIRLIPEFAQKVGLQEFESLQAGDILFIDSTHTVKADSEVNRIVLEILPRLSSGVLVHFHDIFFPYDYTRDFLSGDLFFPMESVLVHAFLACNERFRIEASLSMLHYDRPERLQEYFARYQPQESRDGLGASAGHFPSSTWLRA